MSEWWTYTPADLLMFSPRTYYRLVARYNEIFWPAQVLALAAPAALLARRGGASSGRLLAVLAAAAWAWSGWAFVVERYADINWAARWFAPLFGLEAALLLWAAARGGLVQEHDSAARRWAGGALVVLGGAIYPLLAPLLGRGWGAAEVFGLMPEPTAITTLGLLLLGRAPGRGGLLVVPLVWLAIAGLTLWAMGSAEGWVVALALVLAVASSAR